MTTARLRQIASKLSEDERREIVRLLRKEFGVLVHPVERDWAVDAETILEAIYVAPDLIQRGVKGVLAEAVFRTDVVPGQLVGWTSIEFVGDRAYDLILTSDFGSVTVQVKNQRREAGVPKLDRALTRRYGQDVFVVETQRTRNGIAPRLGGEARATRPYRFGDFDVLAVCLYASARNWTSFIYCPAYLLRPRPGDPTLLAVLQPIVPSVGGWTSDFDEAAKAAIQHRPTKKASR